MCEGGGHCLERDQGRGSRRLCRGRTERQKRCSSPRPFPPGGRVTDGSTRRVNARPKAHRERLFNVELGAGHGGSLVEVQDERIPPAHSGQARFPGKGDAAGNSGSSFRGRARSSGAGVLEIDRSEKNRTCRAPVAFESPPPFPQVRQSVHLRLWVELCVRLRSAFRLFNIQPGGTGTLFCRARACAMPQWQQSRHAEATAKAASCNSTRSSETGSILTSEGLTLRAHVHRTGRGEIMSRIGTGLCLSPVPKKEPRRRGGAFAIPELPCAQAGHFSIQKSGSDSRTSLET